MSFLSTWYPDVSAAPPGSVNVTSLSHLYVKVIATSAISNLNLEVADQFELLLQQSTAINFLNIPASGNQYIAVIRIVQDATGGRTLTGWSAESVSITPEYSEPLDLTAAPNSVSFVRCLIKNDAGIVSIHILPYSHTHQHNELLSKSGSGPEYYHLTAAQYTALISGSSSTLHYHASDRDLSNATGTLSLTNGGTGQSTAQLSINALSGVSSATFGHVLTKDSGTGNALYKAPVITSVYGRTGDVVALSGDYTSSQVTAAASATNYTPTAATVEGNFSGVNMALGGKSATVHTHAISDTTSLQTSLDGKAATAHVHAVADTTGLQTSLDGKAATVHTHAISDTTGLQTALNGKAATAHVHAVADTTGLQTSLDGKSGVGHAHIIGDVTALQTALDSKAAALIMESTKIDSYILVLGDANTIVSCNKATAMSVTVPSNSSVVFPVGTVVGIRQIGAGQVTLVADGGVTLQSAGGKLKMISQFSIAAIWKTGTDTWAVSGDLSE